MINGRHVEVWGIASAREIEETVNEYCREWEFIPISVSIAYDQRRDAWVVALVVEPKGGEG